MNRLVIAVLALSFANFAQASELKLSKPRAKMLVTRAVYGSYADQVNYCRQEAFVMQQTLDLAGRRVGTSKVRADDLFRQGCEQIRGGFGAPSSVHCYSICEVLLETYDPAFGLRTVKAPAHRGEDRAKACAMDFARLISRPGMVDVKLNEYRDVLLRKKCRVEGIEIAPIN